MKKVLAFLAAFTFVFGLSVPVFAVVYEDSPNVTIEKELTINNEGTVNPAETFNFVIGSGTGVRSGNSIGAPDFDPDSFSITVAEGQILGTSLPIDLPEFDDYGVGVYTYPVTETAGNTAGMNYDGKTYQLVVRVINNLEYDDKDEESGPEFLRIVYMYDDQGVKADSFKNDFDAGKLTIEKLVTGTMGSPDDEFKVTVTISPLPGKTLKMDPMTFVGRDSVSQDPISKIITVVYTVKKGSLFTIGNVPYDVTYNVVETVDGQAIGYAAPVYSINKSGTFASSAVPVTITNERNLIPFTGINLDSLPYILLLSGAVIGMGALFIRRRQNASF